MGLQTEFLSLTVDALPAFAADRKREGWRFVQLLAVVTDGGFDLVYSFMKDGVLENYTIQDVTKDTAVPSITDQFLAAFVFENEVHDLFGINVKGIAIDFGGTFYQLSQKEPMTIISPEQKAAREKAKKVAAAKAAKEKAAKAAAANAAYVETHPDAAPAPGERGYIAPPEDDDLETKLAGMDPEKVARVRAAIAAKAKKAAAEAGKEGE